MARIATSVARIKRDALGALGRGIVEKICAEVGHVWRERELDPATTVALFLQQVVHRNGRGSEVRHLAAAEKRFTPSAYCQGPARLPLAVVQGPLTRVCDAALIATRQRASRQRATRQRGHLWLGHHRVFHVDGSSFSMPDTPELARAFGRP